MAQTHPDRLASVATLFGMEPAPVSACRVLEIGCGNGGNSIPMAYYLPGSRFIGVDLAKGAVAEGRRGIGELGISNLDLLTMDLREIGSAMGEFDYIIAHGLYSWVPEDVRDSLLSVCRERLAPHGVALISYNCLPGRHVRMMFRDILLQHVRGCSTDEQRIERACELLREIREARAFPRSWEAMANEEIERMLTTDAGWFFHDDLAPINEAFSIRDFMANAARHSLQFLGDAETNTFDCLEDDVIEREQHADFLCFRQFRQTLLCRGEIVLRRPVPPERMERFLFSSPARQSQVHPEDPTADHVAQAINKAYPLGVAFDRLQAIGGSGELLLKMVRDGIAKFHVHDFATGRDAGARPRSSRLARWETARTGEVTYASHTLLKLDEIVRELIVLLDGTREFEEIVVGLARVDSAPGAEAIRAVLPGILTRMAATGLLE